MYKPQELEVEVARHRKRVRVLQELEHEVVRLRRQNSALVRREMARAGIVGALPALPALPPLPDSIFVHIGRFMAPRDLVSLSLASRRFHSGSPPFENEGGFVDQLHPKEDLLLDSDDDPPHQWSIANESARL